MIALGAEKSQRLHHLHRFGGFFVVVRTLPRIELIDERTNQLKFKLCISITGTGGFESPVATLFNRSRRRAPKTAPKKRKKEKERDRLGIYRTLSKLEFGILELKDMKECAQTPGCMYCLPKWAGPTSYLLYFISSILILISIINFILFIKHKRSKIS